MRKQVQLYVTRADIALFADQVRSTEDVLFIAYRSSSAKPALVATISEWEMGKDDLTVFLARRADLPFVRPHEVPAQHCWVLAPLVPPVVEFSRSYSDSSGLSRGRLYYVDGYYEGDAWVDKSEKFRSWATGVLALARKLFRRDPSTRALLGPEAAALLDGRKIVLKA
jgi:hypothetical protein